jgi:hypothetical protein
VACAPNTGARRTETVDQDQGIERGPGVQGQALKGGEGNSSRTGKAWSEDLAGDYEGKG